MNSLLDRGGVARASFVPPQTVSRVSRPARRSEVRLGSLPMDTEQDLRFLQDRLALFGKTVFIISGLFLVTTLVLDPLESGDQMASRAFHAGATLLALGIWRFCSRRTNLRPDALQAIDGVGIVSLSVLFALMGHFFPQPYGFYTTLLALVHVNVGRAVMVPSIPLRTFVLAVLAFTGPVISRAILPLPPFDYPTYGELLRVHLMVEAVSWSAAAAAVAGVTSRVIYGLHQSAQEARQLGQYLLEEKIGEGGMGEIYRARHAMLRRPTALKLLTGDGTEEQLRRFEREVQLTARLTHPNTISIYDYGRTPDGTFYYAMELLSGMTLEELVAQHGPQPPGRVIHLMRQVCGALSEAHEIGLIHRDIKPANIYLCRRGGVLDVIKVLDFGLVRELKSDGNVTRSNIDFIVGTPLFLAPEAILSPEKIDGRADIYGLGGVMYLLLTGSTPFTGRSVVEICGHQLHSQPEPLAARAKEPVSADLERIVLACLAKDPAARPQTARELADALARCKDAESWRESDAEVFWSGFPETNPASAESGERRAEVPRERRMFCCADVARRLGGRATDRDGVLK